MPPGTSPGQWKAMEPEAMLSVFFEGTANTLRPPTTQIGLFADACAAHDLTPPEARVPRERPEGWRSRRIESASPELIRDLATPSEGFTSLILAAPALDPATALRALLPLLAPSAPFAPPRCRLHARRVPTRVRRLRRVG